MPGLTTHRPQSAGPARPIRKNFFNICLTSVAGRIPNGFAIFCSTCQAGSCFLVPLQGCWLQDLADFLRDALGQKMRRRNSQRSDFMYISWISIAFIVQAYHLQMCWDRCSWCRSQGLLFGAAWPWLQDASRVTVWLCMIERCNHCMLVEVA